MKRVIICDKNQELIDALKELNLSKSKTKLEFICGDVIDLHKNTPNSRIVTASNPDFNPAGGLDKLLAEKYEWEDCKEFLWTEDLFYVVSVDKHIQATKEIIQRAMIGVWAYSDKYTMILTGIGTGIGGMSIDDFVRLAKDVFVDADLRFANLYSADLHFADLCYANLHSVDLRYADLHSADLSSADLHSANLRSANLRSADLSSADLHSADLSSADLRCANLHSAKNLETVFYNENTAFFALQCPEEGSFIGWKKARNNAIVKLLIPEHAKRLSATTRKCRCSEALVVAIYDKDGKEMDKVGSSRDINFIYKTGEMVKVDDFDENRWEECSAGIHFFITRREAEMYNS